MLLEETRVPRGLVTKNHVHMFPERGYNQDFLGEKCVTTTLLTRHPND